MKKIIFNTIYFIFFILLLVPFISSCNQSTKNNDKYYQYIWNHTFSFCAIYELCDANGDVQTEIDGRHVSSGGAGTIWIMDKVNSKPNTYYCATNFHVASMLAPLKNHIKDNMYWTYDPTILDNPLVVPETNRLLERKVGIYTTNSIYDESEVLSSDYLDVDVNAEYWNAPSSFTNYSDAYNFIDFSILEIDFSNAILQSDVVKQKLDSCREPVKFSSDTIPVSDFKRYKYYTLGFPGSYNPNKWIMMDKSNSSICGIQFIQFSTFAWDQYAALSGVYYSMGSTFKVWHGQSGSMVLDENFKIVGVCDLTIDLTQSITSGIRNQTVAETLQLINTYGENKYNLIEDFCNDKGLDYQKYI